jgi:hypothetical protein
MRIILAALVALIVAGGAERASAAEYPWCAELKDRDGSSTNCGFTSFGQCMATVSGVGGFCRENPLYYAGADRERRTEPRRRVRSY